MSEPRQTFAIVYDFDGTLARGNIQESSFIPTVARMERGEFWKEAKAITRQNDADEVLAYMLLMLRKARESGAPIRREDLRWHGRTAQLFAGLLGDRSWFRRMGEFAAGLDFELKHYIISSGIEEMILGCPIAQEFAGVFASKFLYDDTGEAQWPANAINYTGKTQYLFRINKGIENVWDNEAVNRWRAEHERPVPFQRMIFIGDGDTDIPSMKMTTHMGGHSIAVYEDSPDEQSRTRSHEKIHKLIAEDRVNFVAPADYREGQLLDILVKGILGRVAERGRST